MHRESPYGERTLRVPETPANPLDRTTAEATGFATSHPVRAEILSALNEAERSQSELIRLLHFPQSTVEHHLKQLRKAGAIEVARVTWVRGHERHIYRAIRIEDFLAEEMASWSFEERQAFWSRTIQNSARLRLPPGGASAPGGGRSAASSGESNRAGRRDPSRHPRTAGSRRRTATPAARPPGGRRRRRRERRRCARCGDEAARRSALAAGD